MLIKNFAGWLVVMLPLMNMGFSSGPDGQGIEGHVYRVSGNQMPSPDKKPTAPKGIRTTLYIYELTNLTQVSRQGHSSFYSAIRTKLVKKIKTDSTGYFKIELPAGHYSVFVKKGTQFYANLFDGNNNIYPVEVTPQKMTTIEFKVDYDASY